MTKKKRELIEILLDNVKPQAWPESLPYAAQDIKSLGVDFPIYAYQLEPVNSDIFPEMWKQIEYSNAVTIGITPKDLCKRWNKTIVHRDEFMKRWNERNNAVTNATTPPAQQEDHTEETKPIQQEVKTTDTQVGGNHYTKLAIQPMRYSMENGLDALQHTVIKYVTRFRDKNGIEDLEKAKHCIDMLIEFERGKK